MAYSPGHPAGQRAWARAHLTRGSSTGEVWEISSDYPEARLTIGSDPGAGWPIQAPGLFPIHCELFWDGQSLWVADTHGSGAVFLDGHRVTEWEQITGPPSCGSDRPPSTWRPPHRSTSRWSRTRATRSR